MVIVVIELKAKEVIKILPALRELRKEAMHQPGYISGTTLIGVEDQSLISIETVWQSIKDWKQWEKSQTQITLFRQTLPFLTGKSKINIYRYLSYAHKPNESDAEKDEDASSSL